MKYKMFPSYQNNPTGLNATLQVLLFSQLWSTQILHWKQKWLLSTQDVASESKSLNYKIFNKKQITFNLDWSYLH